MVDGALRGMMDAMDDFWGLRRSVTDAKGTGVCAALAERWQVDPLVVRLATVVVALSAGIGVVLYAAASVLLPREGEEHSPLERIFPGTRGWSKRNLTVGALIVAVAFAIAAGSMFPLSVVPTLVLIAAWYFGYQLPRQRALTAPRPAALPHAPAHPATEPAHRQAPAAPATPYFPHYRPAVAPMPAPDGTEPDHSAVAAPAPEPTGNSERTLADIVADMDREATGTDTDPTTAEPSPEPMPDSERTLADIVAEMEREAAGDRIVEEPIPAIPGTTHDAVVSGPDPFAVSAPDVSGAVPAATIATRLRDPRIDARRSKRARRLRLIVLLAMLAGVAGVGAAAWAGIAVPLTAWFAVPAAIAAVGLVVSGWVGRARGLMAIAVITALLAAGAGSPHYVRFEDPDPIMNPVVLSDLPGADITSTFDNIELDLTGLVLEQDGRMRVHSRMGDITLTLPEHLNVVVHAESDLGDLTNSVTDQEVTGISPSRTWEFSADRPDAPTLTVDVKSQLGDVEVRR